MGFLTGWITKFLASKSITIILLVVIITLMFFYWRKAEVVHNLEDENLKLNNTIAIQKESIKGYKKRVRRYQHHIQDLEVTINDYKEKTEDLNDRYNDTVDKLKNVKLVNTVLKEKYNSINSEKFTEGKEEEKANEMLNKYLYTD